MMPIRATILDIAYHLPEGVLSNEQLMREFGAWDSEKITSKTGIVSRRVAADDECASDLAVAAARNLFAAGGHAAADVDFLLYCTQSPDYFLPTTACVLQDRIGLPTTCGAVDMNQGCSGFVYGLALAKGLVESGLARRVLFITAETYSKYINKRDRSTRTIFGDGAAATLIGPAEPGDGDGDGDGPMGPFVLGTDGRGAPNLIVPAGGLRCRPSAESAAEFKDEGGSWRSAENLFMNGPEIFTFTLKAVPIAFRALLEKAGLAMEDVDRFVFHQANTFMLNRLRDKLEIPPEKFVVDVADVGNLGSSSIPVALANASALGTIKAGDRVMLVGFGVGYSWASAIVRWPNIGSKG